MLNVNTVEENLEKGGNIQLLENIAPKLKSKTK